jgi:membrane-associated protease RseP (regulator of RpoE activity)
MTWLVLGLCFVLTVTLHEIGHAVYMRRNGVSIKEICVLGMGPVLFEFRLPFFGDTPVRVRAIPVGAFVLPDKRGLETIKQASFLARGEIYGAGIVANVAVAVALFGFAVAVTNGNHVAGILIFAACLLGAWGLMEAVRWISLGLPFIGIGLIAWTVQGLLAGKTKIAATVAGPITISHYFSNQVHSHPSSVQEGLLLGVLLSLVLGMGNLFPFMPFDGGHLCKNLVRKFVGELYFPRIEKVANYAFLIPGAVLIGIAIGSDLSHLI